MKKRLFTSYFAVLVICVSIFLCQFFQSIPGNRNPNFLSWDVFGYYSYLPYHFIYDDPGQRNPETHDYIFKTYDPSSTYYQAFRLENGNYVASYSAGLSYLYAPFFFIAHVVAGITNYPQDGFSYPYQVCILIGMLLYIFLGLFYLRKLLLLYFSDPVVLWTILIVTFGTNFFHEAFNDTLEPHAVLFAFYCILMYLLEKWYAEPSQKKSIFLGLLIGLMLVVRGSEIFLGILVILWGVNTRELFRQRLLYIFRNLKYYLIAGLTAFIVMLPQFIYFYSITGEFFFNNYQNTEGFNLLKPHLFDFFFSYKKGVFIYTPIVLLAMSALLLPEFRRWKSAPAIILFLILNTYLISCWLVWWGAGSYSSRYFSQSQALLVVPLGFLIARCFTWRPVEKYAFAISLSALLFLNLFQTWQFVHGIINAEFMTKEYYKAVFLKTSIPTGAKALLEPNLDFPDHKDFPGEHNFIKRTLMYVNFDSLNSEFVNAQALSKDVSYDGVFSYRLDAATPYSPTLRLPVKLLGPEMNAWIGVTVKYFATFDLHESPLSIVASTYITGTGRKETKYRGMDLENLDFKINEWNKATFYYQTPRPFTPDDQLTVFVYNRGTRPVYIDQLQVDCFKIK